MTQLQLFEWEALTERECLEIYSDLKYCYWQLRQLRKASIGDRLRRRWYRRAAAHKKRLLMAGVPKRELLDRLACLRHQCKATKPPFKGCKYCASAAT